jgi:drug/metabolite transporter (DMT)-like permease
MQRELAIILTASTICLVVTLAYRDIMRRRPRRFLPTVVLGGLALSVYAFAFPDSIETKGSVDETAAIVFCYLAMVSGMIAEYFYTQAEHGARRLTFEPMTFLMPIFASPIVFIPLLTIMSDIAIGGAFTRAKMMVYLVAFQNGFFWKGFFEQRREKARESPASLLTV